MRYISLTTNELALLTQLYKTSPNHRERQRAHALLLSQRNYSIPDLADFFEVDRDTVSRWMDRWQDWLSQTQRPEQKTPLTLQDGPRPGRTPALSPAQKKALSSGLSREPIVLDA